MRTLTSIVIVAAVLLTARTASAASDSARIQVSVQVIPNCKILISDLAFGAYDPLLENSSRALDGTANLSVLCTKELRANVLMTDGSGQERIMRNGADQLTYVLFSDPARTRTWGSGADAVQIVGTGSTPQELKIFGRVPPGQVVPSGWYTDAVTATVDF
jgi:spore coat protein U-like protein